MWPRFLGKVRLATQTGVLVHLLPAVLEQLAREQPDIEVDVAVLGTHDTLAGLRAGQLDLGLISLPMAADSRRDALVCSRWRSDPLLACLPADWDAPAEVSPARLADKPLIFNSSGTQLYRQTMAWFGQAGFSPSARIELNYTEAMKSLVVAGYGAAVLPLENSAEPHSLGLHERLQLRPLSPPLTRELALVHRPADLLPPSALPVLEVLQGFASLQS